MPGLSSADHSVSPPRVEIPRSYNAAHDLIERNLRAGRADKLAYIDDRERCTYGELARRINRFASGLAALGVRREERILLCLLDSIDWPVAFLGAIKAGVVPIAVNTLLKPQDYAYMLADSRVRHAFVSHSLLPGFDGQRGKGALEAVFVHGDGSLPAGMRRFDEVGQAGEDACEPADTCADETCFWLYSSGSTGMPKGTLHCHSSIVQTAELYGVPVLGIRDDDVVFSAAKFFFAYGLGNALSFPLAVGATTIVMAERPTPAAVFARLTGEPKPTIFYGVPTLFAAMLADPAFPDRDALRLRICASAGEALPERIGESFTARTGVEILDGIGSTEMLHIFLSNRPGDVRYGTTGKSVPGYELRLLDEAGDPVEYGEIGDLYIRGASAAACYWNQRQKTRATFQGEWTKSGDKYQCDADGYFTYAGRSDDMLKVSGQYVSPFEVESAIGSHADVLESAVVGIADADGLIKPKAFVVLKAGVGATDALAETLKQHVKSRLAPFKYPRWVEFVSELPKTATGKIQRFKLR